MTTNVLTQEFVFAALEAERNGEKFPIKLDEVWQVLGYSAKWNAKKRLIATLEENEDFAFLRSQEWTAQGSSSELIGLTVDGYKHFCLLALTEQGRETRKYFIATEKEYRANLERQLTASLQPSTQLDKLKAELAEEEMRADNNFEMWQDTEKLVITLNTFIVDVLGVDLELLQIITDAHTHGMGEIVSQYLFDERDTRLRAEMAQAEKVNQTFKKKKKKFYDL